MKGETYYSTTDGKGFLHLLWKFELVEEMVL